MSAEWRSSRWRVDSLLISCVALSWTLLLCGHVCWAAGTDEVNPGAIFGDADDVKCEAKLEAPASLSLADAIDLALCNNAQIRSAWANIRVQAATVGQARAAYWPTLSATVSELNDRTAYADNAVPTDTHTEETIYGSLVWRLFDFGARAATRRSAEALLEAAVASRDATVQAILSSVVQAYFDAVTAKALSDNKSEDEALARSTLASAQRKQAQGGGAQSDALQAATALARIALDKNRAIATYDKALAALVYSLGVPPGTQILLAAGVDLPTGFEEQDLSAWLKNAERDHPAIVAARAAVEAARDEVVSTRSGGRPTVDLGANYYQNGFPGQGLSNTNSRVTTVGVTITIPLFDGFATRYKIRGAEALVKVKEAALQDTAQSTLMQIVKAHADAQSAFRNLTVSEDLVHTAQDSLESSQRRYSNGAADILELLNTQSALSDARGERVRCLAEWRSARLVLLASAGLLSGKDVQR